MDPQESAPSGRSKALREALASGVADLGVLALVEEASRIVGRLDELDRIIEGKGVLELMRFRVPHAFDGGDEDKRVTVEVTFDSVLAEARQQANALRQILVTLGIGAIERAAPEETKRTALDELQKRRAARVPGAAHSA